ncbi:unnamed protein product [Paramecium primaurelia]|uniref:Uncharacterized protein n=1 Tax=Paramecium primaurelia TaxID=5886 RepID=A0A8S1NE98_PARPR|nr:unnamed protein product [Paramecium primaurelia]
MKEFQIHKFQIKLRQVIYLSQEVITITLQCFLRIHGKIQCSLNLVINMVSSPLVLNALSDPYHTKIMKSTNRKRLIFEYDEILQEKYKIKVFFCSQLIAYIYQLMGLISETEKCCSFLPGNFTDEDKRLDLLKSAQLGLDYIVDFDYLQQ